MKTIINSRVLVMLSLFLITTVFTQAQSFKKAAELRNLNMGIIKAKAKVALIEQKVTVADSMIESGKLLIVESKTETRTIEAERKKLDKDYDAKQKLLAKLSTSKNKGESTRARADLKTLYIQYRSDVKTLDNRLTDAKKKLTKGNANLKRGKAIKKNAQDPLKASKAALKAAQAKYDAAYFSGGNTDPNKNILK